MVQKEKYFHYASLSEIMSAGFRGVDLFFIISGFIITLVVSESALTGFKAAKKFTIRRIFRIFPLYVLLFTTMFLISTYTSIGAHRSFDGSIRQFLTNLLLLPRDDLTTYMPVSAWTLTHELMFYALSLFSFISMRLYWAVLVFWTAVCLLSFFFDFKPLGWGMQLSLMNCYFFLGALCAHFRGGIDVNIRKIVACGALSFLILAFSIELGYIHSVILKLYLSIVYAIGFFFLVFTLGDLNWRLGRHFNYLTYLGKISYSMYLVHYPILVILALLIASYDRSRSAMILFIFLSLISSFVCAGLLYRFVERPGIRVGKILTPAPPG